ncbi:MAG: hypothetical protein SGJ00_06960 [bacterium]|nr:hypothetical protein [bacterium]
MKKKTRKSLKFDTSDQTEASSAEEQLARDNLVKESKTGKEIQVGLLDLPMLRKNLKNNYSPNLKL